MQEVWFEVPDGWEPEPVFGQDHRYAGRARCLHWIFKLGRQCKCVPIKGTSIKPHPIDGYKQKCGKHGGNSPEGIEHYAWKGGRYAKDAGESRQKKLDRLLNDKDLLRLDDNIALLDFRITELFESLREGGNPTDLLIQIQKRWDSLWDSYAKKDQAATQGHKGAIAELLIEGAKDKATWDEIDTRTETRRKLTDSESRRREKMKYLVMVEDTVSDYRNMGRIVRAAIMEADMPKELKAVILGNIQDGFADFMQRGIPERIGSSEA